MKYLLLFKSAFREDNHCLKGRGDMLHNSFQSLVTAQGIASSSYQWKKNSQTHFISLSKYHGEMDTEMYLHTCLPQVFFEIILDLYKQLADFGIGSKHSKSRQNHIVLILKTQTQKYSGYCQQTRPMLVRDKTGPTSGRLSSHLCHNHLLCNLLKYLHLQCYLLAFLHSVGILKRLL